MLKVSNPNVRLTLTVSFLLNLASCVFLDDLLSVYVFILSGGSNAVVGLSGTYNGIAQLLSSIPCGMLADRIPREKVLRLSAALGLVSIYISLYAFASHSISMLYIILPLWGFFYGSSAPAMEAIFADSLAGETRTSAYTFKNSLETLATAAGPGFSMVLFALWGDNWSIFTLARVMCAGVTIICIPVLLLFLFDSRNCLTSESEAILDVVDDEDSTARKGVLRMQYFLGQPSDLMVRVLLWTNEFIFNVGAGITIKFFPIWLKEDFNLNPVQLSSVFFVFPILVSVGLLAAEKLAQPWGRLPVAILGKLVGILCLFAMAFVKSVGMAVTLFILRVVFTRSGRSLERAIVLDCTPKNIRGKWAALENVGLFTFTGSAAFGGVLIDAYGYQTCFVITACIYTIAMIPMIILMPVLRDV